MWLLGSVAVALFLFPCAAQEKAGAKALFHDPTSGVSLHTPGKKAPVRPAGNSGASAKNEVTGLMYWLELLTENGQILRVNSTRVFRTGERVRLNLRSNVDGDLTILQSQDGSAPTLLFPPPGGASASIRANEDQAFPSRSGWFRFDKKPGAIRLLVMMRAAGAAAGPPPPVTLPPSDPPRNAQNRKQPPPKSESQPIATPDPKAAGGATQANAQTRAAQDAAYEAELKRQMDRLRGSKALVVEDDESAGAEARYVVVDRRKDPAAPRGVVALEISLSHQAN